MSGIKPKTKPPIGDGWSREVSIVKFSAKSNQKYSRDKSKEFEKFSSRCSSTKVIHRIGQFTEFS